MRISERIHWVGVNDCKKVLFEGLWPLKKGVSYNSYLIADNKITLVDTVENGFEDEFSKNIEQAIGDRQIDFLVVNHMEPDHSSLTAMMLDKYPGLKIVANAKTVPMLRGYYNTPEERIHVVGDGDTLSTGECTLQFHMTPMVHWPETMMTYLCEENTLFSGDAFGTFGAVNGKITDEENTFEEYKDEMIRYYSNIVGKYGTPVARAMAKLSGVKLDRICSTHGPVWEGNISKVIGLYGKLSQYEAERGVCIVYGSMYGNTAAAAKALADELAGMGVPHSIHNLSCPDALSNALRDAFKYDTIAAGSPTYNACIFPPVETFMNALSARLIKNRRFYAFGSYTWAAASVRLLNKAAEEAGMEVLGEGCTFAQAYSPEKCDMAAIARLIAQ